MKLKSITIKRTESYQTPSNTLVGTVELLDEGGGAMTIVLSPGMLSKFVALAATEVANRASAQARMVPEAMLEAKDELLLSANPLISCDD
jgi:hypothetical protein